MRLIGSLGASLVRLFRKSDTSAPPPKIEPTQPVGISMAFGWNGWDDYRQAGFEPAPSQPQAGIKPPSDETDGQSWAWWLAQRGELIPGWAFCRFANRGGDEVAFVFGHVRGSFGVWQAPYEVCPGKRSDLLTTITHLPSGNAVGLFERRDIAIEAAELADRVADEWATATHSDQLGVAINRTRDAWEGVGIMPCTNLHAHDHEGDVMFIMGRSLESITHGKPERLS